MPSGMLNLLETVDVEAFSEIREFREWSWKMRKNRRRKIILIIHLGALYTDSSDHYNLTVTSDRADMQRKKDIKTNTQNSRAHSSFGSYLEFSETSIGLRKMAV